MIGNFILMWILDMNVQMWFIRLRTLVASSCEHRNELLGLKIHIMWNVILC